MPHTLEGDGDWFGRWQARDRPGAAETTYLRQWLDNLADDPRQPPSRESSRPHPHTQDELRGAFLLDAGPAFVAYAVSDEERVVRILHIGADPPEGVVFHLPV